MTDMFDVTCTCGTRVEVSVAANRELRSFPCPACGAVLTVDDSPVGTLLAPVPGADLTHTPTRRDSVFQF